MLKLQITLDYDPSGSQQAIYDQSPKHRIRIDEEEIRQEISFVFVPQRFLDDYAQGSTLGYVEGENIFIAKNLHPAQVPFVAMYLYFSDLSTDKLTALNQPGLSDLRPEEIRTVFLNVSIAYAGQYLRPQEMSDFLNRFRHEVDLPRLIPDLDEILSSAKQKFGLSEQKDANALVRREERSLVHYTGQMLSYLQAFEHHKAVRRSRTFAGLVQTHPGLDSLFSRESVRCERSYTEIMGDHELKDYLPAIIDLMEKLEGAAKEKRERKQPAYVVLDRLASRVAYFCGEDFVHRRPPLRSLGRSEYPQDLRDIPQDHDVIEILDGHSVSFFASLRRRLLCRLAEQVRTIDAALSGGTSDEEIPTILLAARRLREVIQGSYSPDSETRAMVPSTGQALPIAGARELERVAINTSLVLTGADKSLRLTHALIEQRRDLLTAGADTEGLEKKLLLTRGEPEAPVILPSELKE